MKDIIEFAIQNCSHFFLDHLDAFGIKNANDQIAYQKRLIRITGEKIFQNRWPEAWIREDNEKERYELIATALASLENLVKTNMRLTLSKIKVAETISFAAIKNKEYLETLRNYAIKVCPRELAENLELFGIETLDEKKKMWKTLAASNPRALMLPLPSDSFLERPGMLPSMIVILESMDENERYEMALLMLESRPDYLGCNIQHFKLSDESKRIFLATEIGKRNLRGFYSFDQFALSDAKLRLAFAQQMANWNPCTYPRVAHLFAIEDEKDRLALAQTCIEKWVSRAVIFFDMKNFAITDPSSRMKLLQTWIQKSPGFVYSTYSEAECIDHLGPLSPEENNRLLYLSVMSRLETPPVGSQLSKDEIDFFASQSIIEPWASLFPRLAKELDAFKDRITKAPTEAQLELKKIYVQKLILTCHLIQELDPATRTSFCETVIHKLSSVRDPKISTTLAMTFKSIVKSGQLDAYFKLCKKPPESTPDTERLLPMLYVIKMLPEEAAERADWDKTVERVAHFIDGQKETFKDAKHPDLNIFINFLDTLSKDPTLKPSEKRELLNRSLEDYKGKTTAKTTLAQINANFRMSTYLMNRHIFTGDILDPSKPLKESLIKKITDHYISQFTKRISLDPSEIDQEEIAEIITNMRMPSALLSYLNTIDHIKEPKLIDIYQIFVKSIFTGTFKAERYKTEGHPHLQKLATEFPDIFNKWKESSKRAIDLFAEPTSSTTTAGGAAAGGGAAGGGAAGGAGGGAGGGEAVEAIPRESFPEDLGVYLQGVISKAHLKKAEKSALPKIKQQVFCKI